MSSSDFYRRMLEHAAVAVVATDERFNIVCWNRGARDLLGAESQQMLGKRLDQAVPAQRRKLFMRLVQRTFDRMETTQFEIRLDAAGGPRHLMVVLSPIPGEQGQSQGVAAWVVDQTQSRRLSERLRQAQKMASLGTLAGGVAHHFNNIMGGVATFVDFALTSGDAAAMRRALQMTSEAAARAGKLTHSLLSFAEQDNHRTDLADLTEVVLTFVHLVERSLTQKNIRLELDLGPIPVVAVEAGRMHQALNHLLTNAQEAMPAGGVVRISLQHAGNQAILTFADTGCGIAPEHLPLIFEPFFTTKGLLAGGEQANPGLGLSVVHGIIVEMGGTIEARSTPGEGATFIIHLPIKS